MSLSFSAVVDYTVRWYYKGQVTLPCDKAATQIGHLDTVYSVYLDWIIHS